MIKNKVSIERQINERLYQLLVPFESPLNELLAILDDMKLYVVERIKEAEEKAKSVSEETKSVVEDNPEN